MRTKPKEELFESFRKKFITWFAMISEEQIEEGIEKLEKKYEGRENITYVDTKEFLVAAKPNSQCLNEFIHQQA